MATGKRELIDTGTDKRYVRRDEKGKFDEVVDVGGRFHRTANATPSMRASQGMVTAATGNAEGHIVISDGSLTSAGRRTTGPDVPLSHPRLTDRAAPASRAGAAHQDPGRR